MNRLSLLALMLCLIGITAADAASEISGKEVFNRECIHCHADGEEYTGTRQLAVTRGKAYAVLEQRNDLTAEYVRLIVRRGLMSMPPFAPSSLPEADLEALTKYLAK